MGIAMLKPIQAIAYLLSASLLFPALTPAQQKPTKPRNLFHGSTDIGPTQKGSSTYSPKQATYTITGGGADMWGAADAFHLNWTKLSGDATLTADIQFPSTPKPPLEKAVLIIRQSLDPGSAYADAAIHADGHITLQWRATAGGKTEDTTSTYHGGGDSGLARLRIERKGDQFTFYAGPDDHADHDDQNLVANPPVTVILYDPVYIGLGVCAHDGNGLATVTFSKVTLTPPPAK